jgi:hypothetical protein
MSTPPTVAVDPPCDSTDKTCGQTWTRDVFCYALPSGYVIKDDSWMQQGFKTSMDQCNNNFAKAYDEKGTSVTVPKDNNWQVQTNCNACNVAFGVLGWSTPCTCVGTDTCTQGPEVNGAPNPFGNCKATGEFCHVSGCKLTPSQLNVTNPSNPNMKNTNTPSQMHNMRFNTNTTQPPMHCMNNNRLYNSRLNTSTTQPQMHNMYNSRLYNSRLNTSTTQPQMHNMYNMRLNNSRSNTTTQPPMHYRYNNQCY